MENKYLNEENYKKGKAYLKVIALVIMLVGVGIGVFLILSGISKSKNGGKENLESYKTQLNDEKIKLESKKSELESKGVVSSKKYDSGEAYDLYVITKALDPSISYCLDEFANNPITQNYCSIKNNIRNVNSFGDIDSKASSGFRFIFGAAAILFSCIIGGSIFMMAHGREIVAFQAQQVMPVAKEGINEMAPTIGKAGASIAKEMAPVYGEIAKEIGKGIKEGLGSDNTSNNEENK